MVGEPVDIEVESLQFDEKNTAHLLEHGVSAEDVQAVLQNAPEFFENLPGRSATHVMLGPDSTGRFFYCVLTETEQPGLWRVVTAYPYTRSRALRHYRGQR